jgi:6-phosphogluconolactonase
MKYLFLLSLSFLGCFSYGQQQYLIVGTYTSPGKSHGIYVYRFNTETADAELIDSIKSSNPSFLSVSGNYIYAANHDKTGTLSAYRFDAGTGKLQFLNEVPVSGANPCYTTVTKNGKWVIAGNYSSGNLSVFGTSKDGSLRSLHQSIQHQGSGPNTKRQEAAHVHATVFSADQKFLMVPDLGTDKIMIYRFNAKKGILSAHDQPFELVKAGGGPRHFDFHPSGKWAYSILELTGEILPFKYDGKGHLSALNAVDAQEKDYTGNVSGADIHVSPNGKFLYSSNRGESNTIAVFSIQPSDGSLELVQHQPTMGQTPRNFNFDPTGKFLLVGNQNSDFISVFHVNKETGVLTDTGKRITVPRPSCIKWFPSN